MCFSFPTQLMNLCRSRSAWTGVFKGIPSAVLFLSSVGVLSSAFTNDAFAQSTDPAISAASTPSAKTDLKINHLSKWQEAATETGLESGRKIYEAICLSCHGDLTRAGSLPTSRPFWKAPFQRGGDPLSMFQTVTEGFNQMPPQPWLTPSQAYQVIHYVREELVRPNNPDAYFPVTEAYLDTLPNVEEVPQELTAAQKDFADGPKYLRMDFGNALHWTFEVEPGNIAYKGIAIRLDEGNGGVGKGRAWALFDHDTMRMAAFWSGDKFVDWRGIAFDGSHGTHTKIKGSAVAVNPVGPGWANPDSGSWDEVRLLGRDNKPYGPLPDTWSKYHGSYRYGARTILSYSVGETPVLESPGLVDLDEAPEPIYRRDFRVGPSKKPLEIRLGGVETEASVVGEGSYAQVIREFDQVVLRISERAESIDLSVLITEGDPSSLIIPAVTLEVVDTWNTWIAGGPSQWNETVETSWMPYHKGEGFDTMELELPFENPWGSWMRLGGFDFYEDGNRAVVVTWLGDVFEVTGIGDTGEALSWKRIATGLFQPLGVLVVDGTIYVTCRDQLARLHDLNGDGEIDWVESFNQDHQVTEHFHEFAMGLQRGPDGSFYYAKSARHAKPALVPHHGTLIRVSPDGAYSEIVANGFRAANGVCINKDGTFFVTDQEGHWTPKNRINWVRPGRFYGNWMGFHELSDSSDTGMEDPMVWITNAKDRSPGELVWIPEDCRWGGLAGQLINLSYGTGKIFLAPHENHNGVLQGGVAELPIPTFPTGVMRGRFHPETADLYACGMFAWAGNQQRDGGFYRIRPTKNNAIPLPVKLEMKPGKLISYWSEPLDPEAFNDSKVNNVQVWDLLRSANYGSRHLNERDWKVIGWSLEEQNKKLTLEIPDLAPTRGMSFKVPNHRSEDVEGWSAIEIHATVHKLD